MVALLERNLVFDTTPGALSLHIRDFCGSICRACQPVFLDIEPDANALPRECYFNIERRCERSGGSLQYGWAIWLWPQIWIKAEHHAVWSSPDRGLVDITPQKNGGSRILFLPDNDQKHDPTGQRRIGPIVRALSADLLIGDAIDAERAVEGYEELHTLPNSREMRVNQQEYEFLGLAKTAALFRLLVKYTRKSQPCPCQSDRKFRDCHLPICMLFLNKWDNENKGLKR